MRCVPLIAYFDDIATIFAAEGYKYEKNSETSYSLIKIYEELHKYTISIIPRFVNGSNRMISCFELKVPLKNQNVIYVKRFDVENCLAAKDFLLMHLDM